eukprot:gene19290-biopygen16037
MPRTNTVEGEVIAVDRGDECGGVLTSRSACRYIRRRDIITTPPPKALEVGLMTKTKGKQQRNREQTREWQRDEWAAKADGLATGQWDGVERNRNEASRDRADGAWGRRRAVRAKTALLQACTKSALAGDGAVGGMGSERPCGRGVGTPQGGAS